LKILTLDGGGLQALATLSSINAVSQAIARQNGVARLPAPHELFDVIGGVGTGGWIALLLGRYRLDIATSMAIYMEIARTVDCESRTAGWQRRNRPFKLDVNRLTAVVEETLRRYDLDPALLREDEATTRPADSSSRCKFAFAAGIVQRPNNQKSRYELFRAYRPEQTQTAGMLPGPAPDKCGIAQVFAAIGAAKFFLKPYKLGNTVFFDETFPQSHPITSMALDEVFCLYGRDVEISVLLNIGPGIPSETDCKELDMMSISAMARLTRKFSFGRRRQLSLKQKRLSETESKDELAQPCSKLTSPSETALRMECQRRVDIRARLKELYGESGPDKYHHLGPDYSVEKASLNDVHAIRLPAARSMQESAVKVEGAVSQYWVNARA